MSQYNDQAFEKQLITLYHKAAEKYPKYLFGFHVRDLWVDMSVMLRDIRGDKGNAVFRKELELGRPLEYYANEWVAMLTELDPEFKAATRTGMRVTTEPIIPDENKEKVNDQPTEEKPLGNLQPVHSAA